MLIVRADSPK